MLTWEDLCESSTGQVEVSEGRGAPEGVDGKVPERVKGEVQDLEGSGNDEWKPLQIVCSKVERQKPREVDEGSEREGC